MLLSSGLGVIRCCLTKTKDMWVNFRGIPEPPGLNDITIQRVNSFELRRYRHNVADLLRLLEYLHMSPLQWHCTLYEHTEILVVYCFLYSHLVFCLFQTMQFFYLQGKMGLVGKISQ